MLFVHLKLKKNLGSYSHKAKYFAIYFYVKVFVFYILIRSFTMCINTATLNCYAARINFQLKKKVLESLSSKVHHYL